MAFNLDNYTTVAERLKAALEKHEPNNIRILTDLLHVERDDAGKPIQYICRTQIWFGDTLKDIAHEKTGIIKNNCPVIIADNSPILADAIKKRSNLLVNVLEKYTFNVILNKNEFKTIVNIEGVKYELGLFGKFQAYNFLCAYEIFKMLDINTYSQYLKVGLGENKKITT